MGELYNPYPKLPRNIKQIGEKEETTRLYMEDYVSTYLKSLIPSGENDLRVGLLLGNLDERDGSSYLFVDGAMELENINASIGNVEFTEAVWKKAYQDIEEHFPKRTIQGWFLCGANGSQLKSVDYWKEHGQYFAGKNKLMYLNSGSEGEEEIYIAREDGLSALKGYYIFYERNQMMQDYMIQRNDIKRTETGVSDRVTKDFKERMTERKGQFHSQRTMVRTLSGISGVLSLVVLAGGIVMANNYSQMRQMESVIASVLPDGETKHSVSANDVVEIESVSGNVYPTVQESVEEITEETAETTGKTETVQAGEKKESPERVQETAKSIEKENQKEIQETAKGIEKESQKEIQETAKGIEKEKENQKEIQETAKSIEKEKTEKIQETVKEAEKKKEKESAGKTKETEEKKDVILGGNRTASQAVSKAESGLIETIDVSSGESVRYYIVGEGETLNGICYKIYHNISQVDAICELNGLESQNKIMAGQKLELP